MNSWDDLSIREKAEMMKVAIRNGITSLPDIKDAYNEFAKGGNIFKKGGPKKTSVNPSAQRAMRYFMDKGLTDYQAAGLVGNLMRESGMNPEAVNSSSKAYGLAQWLGSRKKALFAKYGNHPTLDNQLDFIWSELNSTHRNGLKHIKTSKSAEEAARNAMGYYEFSVGPAGAIANMKKYGQDGEGSMAKGITFASRLMGQPVPASTTYSDSPQLSVAETIPQGDFSFTPMNPQVFGMQMSSYQSPVVVPEQPIIVMAEQPTPTPEQLERQRIMQEKAEQRDALNRFGLLMSMSNSQQGNDMMGAIGMLAGLSNGYRSGGGIYIKPSHRGRFTELKERTGHSASWFKEHGTPAQKKMATFALNARHWKHGYGGNLYDGTSQPSQQMDNTYTYYKPLENIFVDSEGNLRDPEVPRARGSILLPEVTSAHPDLKDMAGRYNIASNDATTVANGRPVNMHLRKAVDEGAAKQAAWAQEHPYLNMAGVVAGAAPLAVAGYPAFMTIGKGTATALANPYVDAALTSYFGAHGLNHAINEGINGLGDAAMTALELAPLGKVITPLVLNTGNKLLQYSRLNKTYAGVPHRQVKGSTNYMDDVFPKVHKEHSVWTSNDPDYASSGTWSSLPNNTVFDVYYDPKELSILETPKVPEGQMIYWQGLPYKFKNGKVVYADNTRITDPYGIAKNKESAISGKDIYGQYKQEAKGRYIEKDDEFTKANNFLGNWNKVDGSIKTDDVVRFSRDNKYNATQFHKVYDGGVDINGEYFDYPIDEMVFNPGAQKYILPHGVPKWKVFGQLSNKYNQIDYPLGYIPMPTLVTRINNNE